MSEASSFLVLYIILAMDKNTIDEDIDLPVPALALLWSNNIDPSGPLYQI